MTPSDPAGIWNLGPRCLSIFMACDTVNVPCCAMEVRPRIPAAQIGKTLAKHFTSSTSCMLTSFHLLTILPSGFSSPSIITAALFKALLKYKSTPVNHNMFILYNNLSSYHFPTTKQKLNPSSRNNYCIKNVTIYC